MTLPDGRRLAWEQYGDLTGAPVLSLHGSPGSRLSGLPLALGSRLSDARVRLITFDRPGYGGSDPQPGRAVADVAADVEALLDALDVRQVAVTGGSGGGPHALALATLLPHRCMVVECYVGVAPYQAMGDAFLDGMDPENVRRFNAALQGRDACAEEFRRDLAEIVAQASTDPGTVFASMDLPDIDRQILRDLGPDIAAGFIESGRQGPWGFIDDFIAIGAPWGFDPARASAPVIIEYGLKDVNVPASHGDWLAAHVPHIEVRVNDGAGHLRGVEERLSQLVELANFS